MALATINKSIEVNAPAEKVWRVLTEMDTFKVWTNPFMPGASPEDMVPEGEFGPGAVMTFKDDQDYGMTTKVVTWEPAQKLKLDYVSEFIEGEETTDADREDSWIGGYELYELVETGGKTVLDVENVLLDSEVESFSQAWDKALEVVKELSEQ